MAIDNTSDIVRFHGKTDEVYAIVDFIGYSERYGTLQKDRAVGFEHGEELRLWSLLIVGVACMHCYKHVGVLSEQTVVVFYHVAMPL